jgi:hypothetical protein
MKRDPLPLHSSETPDDPVLVIGEGNAAEVDRAYAAPGAAPALPTSLQDLATPSPWAQPRQLWMLYGAPHPDTLTDLLGRITPSSRLVVVDPQPVGSTALDAEQRTQLATLIKKGQLHIVVGGTLTDRSGALAGLIDIDTIDGWKPLFSQALVQQAPETARDLLRLVSSRLNTRIMLKSTRLTMGGRFLLSAFLNAPWGYGPDGIAPLHKTLDQRPALIVSAGPSLNKQLPLLAQNQHLFTIFAVDTVWPILNTHGIVPDYLVALDPVTLPSWPRDGLSPHTRLVTDMIASPNMVWSHDRGHIMTCADGHIAETLGFLGARPGRLGVGGSVATLAFNMAVHMGANPIVLIGQDLALTGGKDHADGYLFTYSSEMLQGRSDKGYDVEGYYGDRVRTERQLLAYKAWFEERFKELPEVMVINATEGGARIAGSLQIPFAQVCKHIGMTSLRKEPHPLATPEYLGQEQMAQLLKQLAKLRELVVEYGELASRAQALTRGKAQGGQTRRLRDIDRINKRLKDFSRHAKHLVDACSSARLEAIRYGVIKQEEDEDRSLNDAILRYREVYQSIQEACEVSCDLLDKLADFYREIQIKGRPDPALLDSLLA